MHHPASHFSVEQEAVFDLAWPDSIQEELSQPVAVLLNEALETMGIASKVPAFTAAQDLKD